MGRPVILSDLVGCAQDLVDTAGNGLIFPAGDVPALTACLHKAFEDAGRLADWGERSRIIVQNNSYEEASRGLIKALDSL